MVDNDETLISAQKADHNGLPDSTLVLIPAKPDIQILLETEPDDPGHTADDNAEETSPTIRPRSVRFRSRVRITSGIHHHRKRRPSETASQSGSPPMDIPQRTENLSASNTSSLASSPSSSISAPLAGTVPHSPKKPRLGPLGLRIRAIHKRRSRREGTGERQSLLSTRRPRRYDQYDDEDGDLEEILHESQQRLNEAVEEAFGKWPWRIFNRHWWWWHMKPIVRCSCLNEESDTDDV